MKSKNHRDNFDFRSHFFWKKSKAYRVYTLPWLNFPRNWKIKIIPPFAGVCIRFQVSTSITGDKYVSVFLDDSVRFGEEKDANGVPSAYWEIYDFIDYKPSRCFINETSILLELISDAINRLEKLKNKNDKC